MAMKVFVTGGTGFVGSYVLEALRLAGHLPYALVRSGSENKLPFREGLVIINGDVHDPVSYSTFLKDMDAVIHLIGIIREFPGRRITFQRMHAGATRKIVEESVKQGVKRFIHMSANGASESGVSGYQTTKAEGERIVISSGMRWTIFRPSVIFGDPRGRMEFVSELAKPIKLAPIVPVFGDGQYKLEPVAVEDVAKCFTGAINNPAAEGRVFHLGGGTVMTYNDVVQTIGRAVGRQSTHMVKVPFGLMIPLANALGGFSFFPVTGDQLKMLGGGNVCPEHDYQKVFGVTPKPFTKDNLAYLTPRR
ncbi:MAG: NAD-dependent epimerase/dehydratase family protein [Nitrospinae bacterium]|nr:NAD-dependent epimerase/dehydratase family protein [Nitrospinota bacterium]